MLRSAIRITLYTILFFSGLYYLFHFALSPSSVFYQITPAPNVTPSESTKQAKTIVIPKDLPTAIPSETPIVVSPTPDQITYYTVQAGDTLEKIAKDHNLNWLQLANYNQLNDPNTLQIGQIIKISNNPDDYEGISPYYQEEIYQAKEGEKHILVVLSEQRLYTYEGDQLIGSFLISSGVAAHPTVTGVFKVWIKLPTTTMSGGTGSDAYYLPGVKHTMYFYGDYGIHGTYWHNNFGTPMSHGCLNMSNEDAEIVYNWADIGTIVQVIP